MRQRLSLDGAWQFAPDPDRMLDPAALAATELRTIQVLGPWQAQCPDLRDYTGLAWYRRTFRWSEPGAPSGEESVYLLHFGAVDYHATVWLNGERVGEHEGGYLPFELPVTSALRLDGDNELVVRVVDPGSDADADLGFPFAEVHRHAGDWFRAANQPSAQAGCLSLAPSNAGTSADTPSRHAVVGSGPGGGAGAASVGSHHSGHPDRAAADPRRQRR